MRNASSIPAVIGALLLLSACSTTGQLADATAAKEPSIEGPMCILPKPEQPALPAMPADNSVYFDFDNYEVRQDYWHLVQEHATHTQTVQGQIQIQGNADERGGSEYNLALGQKRAEAVRKSMAALGVAESRMEAVSLGEEKPKAEGHNEEAWSQNRRADIVYKAK